MVRFSGVFAGEERIGGMVLVEAQKAFWTAEGVKDHDDETEHFVNIVHGIHTVRIKVSLHETALLIVNLINEGIGADNTHESSPTTS